MSKRICIHLVAIGQVQGVGFRRFAQQTARELRICGWVRNKADGSVELELEGPKRTIELYIEQLKRGNQHSQIDRIFRSELPLTHDYQSFYIRY